MTESFVFAVTAVSPIVLMVALGYALKGAGFMSADFAGAANRLVFRVFLPAMLFLNIYKIESLACIEVGYILYVVVAQIVIFLVSIPPVFAVTKVAGRRGVLLQGIFRSNYALIGIPLAQALFGDEGVAVATVLSAVIVPVFNVLGVISLSVFRDDGARPSVSGVLRDIATNPLIMSIAAGLAALGVRALLVQAGIPYRLSDLTPVYKVLEYLSALATPMALLVLGAQFEFSVVGSLRREIVFGTLMRVLAVPALGIGCAYLFFRHQFDGAHFAAFTAVFATPVAVSSVPMAQEMKSDAVLAGQLVVWSTLFSTFSVFVTSFLLKAAGIF